MSNDKLRVIIVYTETYKRKFQPTTHFQSFLWRQQLMKVVSYLTVS